MTPEQVFAELHAGLAQQAPGSDASTLRALAAVPYLPAAPRILDVGCGPGRQTLALARATGGHVTAVDTQAAFLAQLEARAAAAGLAERVTTRCESMAALALPDAGFDLLWSEGALYSVGFERALRALRRLLRPGGALAATELCWLQDDPPVPARVFWRAAYPALATREANRALLRASGYVVVADFVLPASDWWQGYYAELEPRIAALRARCAGDVAALSALANAQDEIDLFRAHPGAYGYVFFVARRA
jgi:serine/threonine-protein kinase HipA